jgi:hypothetical protein
LETGSVNPLVELSFLLLAHRAELTLFYLAQNKEIKQAKIRASVLTEKEVKLALTEDEGKLSPVSDVPVPEQEPKR